MDNRDYNDALLENAHSLTVPCTSCKTGIGELKILDLSDDKPDAYVVAFECTDCGYKDEGFYNKSIHTRAIAIDCLFTSKKDCTREIYLNQGAEACLSFGDTNIDFDSSMPMTITLEGWFNDMVSKLKHEDNETVKQLIHKWNSTKEYKFTIRDKDGYSRVGRIGCGIYEMKNEDIEAFNDDSVRHYYID